HGWRYNMAEVYGDVDVAVNTSLNEGTPVALIEAMAAGRPVVATRVGGTPDLLGHGERGILVAPADIAAIANGVCDVLKGGAAVQNRTAAARTYELAQHGVGRLVRDIDGLYREMLGLATG